MAKKGTKGSKGSDNKILLGLAAAAGLWFLTRDAKPAKAASPLVTEMQSPQDQLRAALRDGTLPEEERAAARELIENLDALDAANPTPQQILAKRSLGKRIQLALNPELRRTTNQLIDDLNMLDLQAEGRRLQAQAPPRQTQAEGVGAFWDPQEVRDSNKVRRRTQDLLKLHRAVARRVVNLAEVEADLEDMGVDVDRVNHIYDLTDWTALNYAKDL